MNYLRNSGYPERSRRPVLQILNESPRKLRHATIDNIVSHIQVRETKESHCHSSLKYKNDPFYYGRSRQGSEPYVWRWPAVATRRVRDFDGALAYAKSTLAK
jgi:hypothetical protein